MPLPHPDDKHLWREGNWDERQFVPEPHSSQIVCDRCGLWICALCGTDDPNYESICAAPGKTFPPKFQPPHEHEDQ